MDIRWVFAALALAASAYVLREVPALVRRRRRWRQIRDLLPMTVRALDKLPEDQPPGEVVVAGRPLSPPPSAPGGFDFDLEDPTDAEARAQVVTSEAPLVEYPVPDADLAADQAGDALFGGAREHGAALYIVAVARHRAPPPPPAEDEAVRDGVIPPEGAPADGSSAEGEPQPRPRPWRLEPTLGPDGRLELIAFRHPDVPAQQARHALLTLVAAGAVLAFSLYIVARLLWPSLLPGACP